MSLTVGTGPFSRARGTLNAPQLPDHIMYWEDWPRRMRAVLGNTTILDTREGKLLHETGKLAAHYYPMDQIRCELLERSPDGGNDEHKGESRQWHLRVGDRFVENAVTEYLAPPPHSAPLAGWATITFAAMDRWFEEDEPIYAHPRDPYHRVDVRASSRHVVVRHNGQVIAESNRPKMLFETGLPIRYYLPFLDVRIDLLERSETISECPYKGDGQHWHLDADPIRVEDAAWSLPHPAPEGFAALEHVCFYPNKVIVEVDGEPLIEPSIL